MGFLDESFFGVSKIFTGRFTFTLSNVLSDVCDFICLFYKGGSGTTCVLDFET